MAINKRLLDRSGATERWHYWEPNENRGVVEVRQDCNAIIERNKALANDSEYSRLGIKKEWWHIATVPNIVINKWLVEHGVNFYNPDHWPKIKKLMSSRDYEYLRPTKGAI